jgi:(5-formylfuran-3-yl)methyl phosphate synthase
VTLFLASVRDGREAEMALGAGADIIDLKDPHNGALGALDPETLDACVSCVAGRAPVSATIGDLPLLQRETVGKAVLATAAAGVDYVKLGLFPGDGESSLDSLHAEARHVRLILVLFADALPDFDAVAAASRIGAEGVMLDTLGKAAGSVLEHASLDALAGFVAGAKAKGLIVGLAGSLRANHVPELLALAPDLLGFRGALCHGGARAQSLDPVACAAIRALIPQIPAQAAQGATVAPHRPASVMLGMRAEPSAA